MAQSSPFVIPVDNAAVEPYSLVLSYPKPSVGRVESRIRQLKELGVLELELKGPLKMEGLSLLGKGVSSLVVVGLIGKDKVALKIRRVDSRRDSVVHEARMLQEANSVGVGPRYLGNTQDVLAMTLVRGDRLPVWLSGLGGRGRKARVKRTVRQLLEQCYRLDEKGLDHGELSRAHKNVLVSSGDQGWILDFESASTSRRPANFTSLAQYLFLGGGLAKKVAKILGPVNRTHLLESLRLYKFGKSSESFEKALVTLSLASAGWAT